MTQPDYAEAHALREAQAKEYGQWVAVEPIDIGGARAFNIGDPVPASHVDRGVVEKSQVVGANTKTASTITEKG